MKNIKNILIIILILVASYFVYDGINSRLNNDKLQEELDQQQESIDKATDSINKLNIVVDLKQKKVAKNEAKVDSLQQKEKTYQDQANYYKKSYKELLKEKPKTTKDTINNLQRREIVLLSENKALDSSNVNLRGQVSTLQIVTAELKEIVIAKDSIIKYKDITIYHKDLMLGTYINVLKKEKKKSLFTKIGAGLLVVVAFLI